MRPLIKVLVDCICILFNHITFLMVLMCSVHRYNWATEGIVVGDVMVTITVTVTSGDWTECGCGLPYWLWTEKTSNIFWLVSNFSLTTVAQRVLIYFMRLNKPPNTRCSTFVGGQRGWALYLPLSMYYFIESGMPTMRTIHRSAIWRNLWVWRWCWSDIRMWNGIPQGHFEDNVPDAVFVNLDFQFFVEDSC